MHTSDIFCVISIIIFIVYLYAWHALAKEGDVPTTLMLIPLALIVLRSQVAYDRALYKFANILIVLGILFQFLALYELDANTSLLILPYLIISILTLFKINVFCM